jgi:hypothetical protein
MIKADSKSIRIWNAFPRKRNTSSYKMGGAISDEEAYEMADLAKMIHTRVE